MKPKFKIGDKVRIGTRNYGYDIVQILNINDYTIPSEDITTKCYTVKILTRNNYLKNTYTHISVNEMNYVYPADDWEMEYADNALQRLKKRLLK